MLHQSSIIFFYLFVNHYTHLSSSISPFLCHSIIYLSTSIFFYLFVNLTSRLSFSIFILYLILCFIYPRESFSMSLSILIHVYLLQSPLFYLILSFIYQRQSFSIFLPIWSMPISPYY